MSVYTPVGGDELRAFLATYDVGELRDYRGISAGIENTNYFVDTSGGRWVLTLFETLPEAELPFCLDLMGHLAARGVPSPRPQPDRQGQVLRRLNDRPAALVQRLSGASVSSPSVDHCAAMGRALGRLHRAAGDFPGVRANSRGPAWWQQAAARLDGRLDAAQAALLREELAHQERFRHLDLPTGIIHGDLFHDNALFEATRISGLIDFYYACRDVLLFDVAVAVNDWCVRADGTLDEHRANAALSAYAAERPLQAVEALAWAPLLRAAALRFWLSRLVDLHFPRPGEITHTKDPQVFRRILERHIAAPPSLPAPLLPG